MLEWRKEGRKKGNSLQQKTNIISVTGWRGGRLSQKKKKKQFQLHHFFCFQVSHFKLLTLPVHLSLGKKRTRVFHEDTMEWNKMNTGLGQAQTAFQLKWDQVTLEGEKEAMQRSDRFPITKNHSFFQRLRDSGAHPFFTFSSLLLFRPKGWMGRSSGYRKGQSTGFPEAGTCSQVAGVQEKGRNDAF